MEAEGGKRLSPEAIARRCSRGCSLAEDAAGRGYRWRLSPEAIARCCSRGCSLVEDAAGRGCRYHWRLSLDAVREAVRWQRMPLAEAIIGGCRRRLSLDAVRKAIPWQRMPLAEAIVGGYR